MLDGGEAAERHYRDVLAHEDAADAITRDVAQAVRRTFVTPFDRGDIRRAAPRGQPSSGRRGPRNGVGRLRGRARRPPIHVVAPVAKGAEHREALQGRLPLPAREGLDVVDVEHSRRAPLRHPRVTSRPVSAVFAGVGAEPGAIR